MSLDLVNEFQAQQQQVNAQQVGEIPTEPATEPIEEPTAPVGEIHTEQPTEQTADTVEPTAPTEPAQQTTPVFDWGQLSERTGGVLKDEDSLNALIEKANQADSLNSRIAEYESGYIKPNGDFVQKLNTLIGEGASKDKIEAFWQINQVGDLNTLSPREILVTKEMLLNGASRDVAEYSVDTKYDTSAYEEDSIEYKHLLHTQSVDSKAALSELEKYKGEVSTVVNEEKEKAEQARLQAIADDKKRMDFVKQEAPKLAQAFTPKLNFEISEGKSFEHSFDEKFKSKIEEKVVDFFDKTKLPLTQENLQKVGDYLEMQYFAENRQNIVKDMYNKIESQLREELSNKFQNITGLPAERFNPNPDNTTVQKSQKEVQDAAAKQLGII